ncbi:MAG: Oxidoreductase, short chain dehydrogenase/reductase family protein [Myxococcales bacterium]|nr:Oxidoreductase, short chain dehydrogenase/reductase family protein [Myxococcales bacterium]
MKIEGQGALVTGASRGLGRALAELLGAKGARVAMIARDAGPLSDAVATIRARGGVAHGIVADIAAKDAVHKIAGQAQGLIGEIGIAIHNASTLGPVPLRLLLDTECEDLAAVLETNLVGPFRLTKILAGAMALRGEGVIVHISSDAAVEPYPTWGAYGISKAAQDHLSRVLAAELSGTGVRVLAVDPGEMDTKMHADAVPDADRKTLQRPADVAARIVAMIADEARAVSGVRLVAPSFEVAP